jgi:hypothetical protein
VVAYDARDPRCLVFDDRDRGRLLLILPKMPEAIRTYRLSRGEGIAYDLFCFEDDRSVCPVVCQEMDLSLLFQGTAHTQGIPGGGFILLKLRTFALLGVSP